MFHSDSYGVYVHVPFCAKRCDYCAFATWVDKEYLIDSYIDACISELGSSDIPIATSVFFGGGTPSLIDPEKLCRVLDVIKRSDDAEVTIECNPDTVSEKHFKTYVQSGVNRVSIGAQSMIQSVLMTLGRTHDINNVRVAVELARQSGIQQINVDLIYGSVGESVSQWRETLLQTIDLSPTHISAYALTIEAGTPLAKDVSRHPDEDDQADKYLLAQDLLSNAGYENYEISNWAQPGSECKHNWLYWMQGNYRGVGCSAHSHQDGKRWWNITTPERYIKAVAENGNALAGSEVLDSQTKRFEKLELLLRTKFGVPLQEICFEKVEEFGEFLNVENERVSLNVRGRLMANRMAVELIP